MYVTSLSDRVPPSSQSCDSLVHSVGYQQVERKVLGELVIKVLGKLPEDSSSVFMTTIFTQNLWWK